MRKRGNPTWSQGEPNPLPSGPSEFERVVIRLKLSPDQYASSPQLRAWAEKKWREKLVPEYLLKAWGFRAWPLSD